MATMKSRFIDTPILYDGIQLRSNWIRDFTHIKGDVIASFIGPANVPIEKMVDLEDVARNAPIFSEDMLHFIVEHFDKDLERMVLRQRLLIAILHDLLHKNPSCRNVQRKGNDLYDDNAKLSVSVATSSPVSCLIHTGINISSANTPVLTKGLKDYDIDPLNFSKDVLKSYVKEMEGVNHAGTKVRPVA